MPRITMSDGCSIYYRFDGDPEKPVLLFSNPHGFTHRLWDSQIDELTCRYRILRYDFRGHGGSDAWSGEYSLERAAQDVMELIDNLVQGPAAFCGLSIGGMVGIWLAANTPDRLSAAVLANTSPYLDPADHLKRRMAQIETSGMHAAVGDIISRSLSETFRSEHPATTEQLETMVADTSPAGYIAGAKVVLEMDLRSCLQSIDLPVLVIAGSHDNSTPPSMGKDIAGKIPGARFVLLESAHLSNIERKTEFNKALLDFLP